MKKIVRYAFEGQIKGVVEVEVTLGTLTILGLGDYGKLSRQFRTVFEDRAGFNGEKPTPEQMEGVDDDLRQLSFVWTRWARIRSAITRIRVVLDGAGMEGEFIDGQLSDLGWDNLDGIGSMPGDLFEALDVAAIQVNPRVFGGLFIPDDISDPNARKVGLISVS